MKKLVSFALALALSAALSTTALATEINETSKPQFSEVEVTTSIDPTYTVSIPANTTVKFNAVDTDFGEIKLTAAQLDPGKTVKVELSASGTLKNAKDKSKTLAYQIQTNGKEFESASYLNANESTKLNIHIAQKAWNKAYAGSYSDTVKFTISYVDVEQ